MIQSLTNVWPTPKLVYQGPEEVRISIRNQKKQNVKNHVKKHAFMLSQR